MEVDMISLIIFDADNTLVDRATGDFLPGVREYLDLLNHPGCRNRPALAIATNQGGPACHKSHTAAISAIIDGLDETIKGYSYTSKSAVKYDLAQDRALLAHALRNAEQPLESLAEVQVRLLKLCSVITAVRAKS